MIYSMDQNKEIKKHYWLYVLQLEEDKYYIGTTAQKDPNIRIKQHTSGGIFTSKWVDKYPYKETLELIELGNMTKTEAELVEDEYTLRYMKEFKYNNVRGGRFTYRGEYRKLGNRFFREEQFSLLLGISFMTFVMLIALIEILRR